MRPRFLLALFLLPVAGFTGCATPSRIMADAEIDRLCAIDGGLKIYETVALSTNKFHSSGFHAGTINFFDWRKGKNALGPEYIFEGKSESVSVKGLDIQRTHSSVTRVRDSKLLGEVTNYARSGGDAGNPFRSTIYTCNTAVPANQGSLLKNLFIMDGAK